MADISVAAVLRDEIFSPNRIANDAAILHAVVAELRKRGCLVTVYSEGEFCDAAVDDDVVVAMCRTERAVQKLQALEDGGCLVVNSGYGIENCVRMIMVRLLEKAGLPMPTCFVVDTDVDVRKMLGKAGFGPCWVKKADARVHHLEDIARCRHAGDAQEILHEFFFRRISKAVVSRDIEGEQIRCYGVASSGWFHSFIPFRSLPDYSGGDGLPAPLAEAVKRICMEAADVLKVEVFGCDVVLDRQGELYIVNFDDWPSFSPIRSVAAREIAKAVLARKRKSSSNRNRV